MPTLTYRRGIRTVPLVKIGPKHQITIPKGVFDALHLETGDILELAAKEGKVVLIPKQLVAKAPMPKLSAKEQKLVKSAKTKIAAIQRDLVNSTGLTRSEADVAAKSGLIDPEQRYWWLEDWQKWERAAERDIKVGRVSVFETTEELLAHLHKQSV